jgi:hypothetical protein
MVEKAARALYEYERIDALDEPLWDGISEDDRDSYRNYASAALAPVVDDNGRDQADEIETLRQELAEARAELGRWRSGQRRKGMPVVDAVPDAITYAAALVRAQGTDGGETHDRLLAEAGQRMKQMHDTATALLAERDAMRDVVNAARAYRNARYVGDFGLSAERLIAAVDALSGPGEAADG